MSVWSYARDNGMKIWPVKIFCQSGSFEKSQCSCEGHPPHPPAPRGSFQPSWCSSKGLLAESRYSMRLEAHVRAMLLRRAHSARLGARESAILLSKALFSSLGASVSVILLRPVLSRATPGHFFRKTLQQDNNSARRPSLQKPI
jgi:hypothetical protein